MSNSTVSITSTTPGSTSATSTPIDTSSIASSLSSVISSQLSTSTPESSTSFTSTTTEISSATDHSTSTISETSIPPTTAVITSVVTQSPTASDDTNTAPITVVITATRGGTTFPVTTPVATTGADSTTSSQAALNTGGSSGSGGNGGSGLSTAGVTAVAVVVPVAVVALLVLAGIFFWRKRKQKKDAEEQRRKEVEDYGFNPNNDPTLPTVASESGQEMSEDHSSGYRGWGAATGSNRKMSTTLSGGHTQGQLSDAGSNPYRGGVSPTGAASDGNSGDAMLNQRRETMNSDEIGSLGHGPVAGAAVAGGMKRGPSNASSTYSAGNHSDVSDGPPPGSMPQSYEAYNPNNGYGYSQHGPYGDGTYGGGGQENGMPIVRDVSARRNTRIQQPGNYQQGNSGIAQNF